MQARESLKLRVQKMRAVREESNNRNGRELAGGGPQNLQRKARDALSRPRRGVGLTAVKRRPPRIASPFAAVGVPGVKAKASAGAAKLPRLGVVHRPGKNSRPVPVPRMGRLRIRIKKLAPNRKTRRSQRGRDAAGVRVRGVVPGRRSRLPLRPRLPRASPGRRRRARRSDGPLRSPSLTLRRAGALVDAEAGVEGAARVHLRRRKPVEAGAEVVAGVGAEAGSPMIPLRSQPRGRRPGPGSGSRVRNLPLSGRS